MHDIEPGVTEQFIASTTVLGGASMSQSSLLLHETGLAELAPAKRSTIEDHPGITTIAAALRAAAEGWVAETSSNGVIFHMNRDAAVRTSYRDLWYKALSAAGRFRDLGIAQGDRVIFMVPTSEAYVSALFGAIVSGIIPCTVASPGIGQDRQRVIDLLRHTIVTIGPALVIVTDDVKRYLDESSQKDLSFSVTRVLSLSALQERSGAQLSASELPELDPDHPLHIQLTSGTTRRPKGALLTHRNTISNIKGLGSAIELELNTDRILSWLPFYHDMGFVKLLLAVYYQTPIVLSPSSAFMRNPLSWIHNISAYGITLSAAPTFAYSLCAQRYDPSRMDGADLSSWRLAFVGAEPVSHSVLDRFARTFSPHGLREDALYPSYGMAETVLGTAVPRREQTHLRVSGFLSLDQIDADVLRRDGIAKPIEQTGRAESNADAAGSSMVVVGHGRALDGLELTIRDATGGELPERIVGEICARGGSLLSHYFNDVAATDAAIRDGWYHTGDRGYFAGGELFILGRLKDLLIVRGRNYDPHNVETIVEECPSVRLDSAVAFGRYNPDLATDDVVVVIESRAEGSARDDLRAEVQLALSQTFGFVARDIVIVGHGSIPRTTSHKKQRGLTAQWYADGQFADVVAEEL